MKDVPGLQGAIDATNTRAAGAKVSADHAAALKAFKEQAAKSLGLRPDPLSQNS